MLTELLMVSTFCSTSFSLSKINRLAGSKLTADLHQFFFKTMPSQG